MAQAFKSNRDVIIRSAKYGRSYEFKKGVPRDDIIAGMHQDLLNAGILPVDGTGVVEDKEIVVDESPSVKVVLPPEDGEERKQAILAVMAKIVERNDSGDFTGGNSPKAAVVSQMLGWRVDTKDVATIWKEHKAELVKR